MGLVAKAFQDIITFSRASSGTYVNSNGYITNSSVLNYLTYSNAPENAAWTKSNSFVQQNLLLRSEEFDNATWTKPGSTATANTTLAPNGTLTADTILADTTPASQHRVDQIPVSSAGPQTYSVYLKYFGYQWASIRIGGTGASFDILNGVVGFTTTATSRSIESVGNGWYRCVIYVAAAAANDTCRINIENADTIATNFTGTGTTGLYAWGAQCVQGSVPGDYRATTSAALPCLYADYNGALRARKLCEGASTSAHFAYQNGPGAGQYILSEYFKAGERTRVALGNSFAGDYAVFDLSAGTVVSAGSGTVSGGTITSAGNGYYRCTASCAPSGVWNPAVVTVSTGTTTNYTGDGSSGIYIADAQLNDGSSALSYYNTDANAYNAPRFDYDPVTLAAKGLLVEESRANLLLQSNDFFTSWTPTNITRTLNSILSPSGNVDGVKIAATATAATALAQSAIVSATSATGSVYVKQGTSATVANTFTLRNNTTATNLISGTLNYSTGVWSYSIGSTGVVVRDAGNGWWRLEISATAGITSGNSLLFYVGFAGGAATAGDFLYAYQAQLEAGAFATSVIPTVASQVTRAADVASVNTLSPWYNSVAGTLYAEYDAYAPISGAAFGVAVLNDGTASNRTYLFLGGGTAAPSLVVTSAGTSQANIGNSAISANTTAKTAGAYAVNDFAVATNAGTVATDASGALPVGLSKLDLGGFLSGTFLNGHLRRVTYYPRRLTNAELQTLTTL